MKVDVMLEVVRSKFARDSSLQQKLLATQNQLIVEGHTGDKFWGGKANHLGNILMRVREELRVEQQQVSFHAIPVDTSAEEVSVKTKRTWKGSSDRQALFQDQVAAWVDGDALAPASPAAGKADLTTQSARSSEASNALQADDQAAGDAQEILPSAFVAWLRSALEREGCASDAEGLICCVEVILGALVEDPSQDPQEALSSAAELLRQDAPLTASELPAWWAVASL